MSAYVFDLGFDYTNGGGSLQMGLVDLPVDQTPSPDTNPNDKNGKFTFNQDDFLWFNLFNLTPNAQIGDVTGVTGQISFAPGPTPATGQPSSPFDGATTNAINVSLSTSDGKFSSAIFSGGPFPWWQYIPDINQVSGVGDYVFTILLNVTTASGTWSFRTDPEMIVQATPPGGNDFG